MKQLNDEDFIQDIYTVFINHMSYNYVTYNSNERIIIDYISGMTDDFFLSQFTKYCKTFDES